MEKPCSVLNKFVRYCTDLKAIRKLNPIDSVKLFLYQIASTYIKIITLWRS